MSKENCVLVLGMHRSGASVLTGCLNILGLNLGNSLMAWSNANEDGHFENQDIVLAHDILLRDLGYRWDMVGNLPAGWLDSEAARNAANTLTGIIERQFLGQGPFAVKDPRLCRLAPLWLRILESLDVQSYFILMVRHPMEVARSLQKRDGFDLVKSHLLWMVHNREALQACQGRDHLVATFDQVLADPLNTLRRIGDDWCFPGPNFQECVQKLLGFIRPDLKHHHQASSDVIEDGLFAHYGWVYDQIRNLQARALAARLESGKEVNSKALSIDQGLAEFPLALPASSVAKTAAGQKSAAEVFNDLLGVIGRYEQEDLDRNIRRQRLLLASTNAAETIYCQGFFPGPELKDEDYTEDKSRKILLAPEEWQQLTLDIPRPEILRTQRLRIDPLNTRGMVSISSIKLVHAVTGEVCWAAQDPEQLRHCSVEGDGLVLSLENGLEMICTGNDARVLLPLLPDLPDTPLRLEVWIKASRRQTPLHNLWADLNSAKNNLAENLEKERTRVNQSREQVKTLESCLSENEAALQAKESRWQTQGAEQQARIKELEQKVADREKSRADLERRLKHLEELSRQYFSALADAEQEAVNSKFLLHENRQLAAWINKLNHNFQALKASRRWRAGNAIGRLFEILRFRSKSPMAVDSMQEIFDQFQKADGSVYTKSLKPEKGYRQDGTQLVRWMDKLQEDFGALLNCRRWRMGNLFFRFAEILLFRPRVRMAPDNIQEIFAKYGDWRMSAIDGRSASSLDYDEIKQLLGWMRKLDHNCQAMLTTRRWRLGNKMGRIARRLLFRPKTPMVTEDMQRIFEQYRERFQ